jgi:hypothetical protein
LTDRMTAGWTSFRPAITVNGATQDNLQRPQTADKELAYLGFSATTDDDDDETVIGATRCCGAPVQLPSGTPLQLSRHDVQRGQSRRVRSVVCVQSAATGCIRH